MNTITEIKSLWLNDAPLVLNGYPIHLEATVKIPVGSGEYGYEATIDYEDYLLLLSLGVTGTWLGEGGRIVARVPSLKRYVPIARVIANTKAGEMATYKDGDYSNLRRSNIVNKVPHKSRFEGEYHERAILEGRSQEVATGSMAAYLMERVKS